MSYIDIDSYINFGGFETEPKSEGAKALAESRKQIRARYIELQNAAKAAEADETLSPEEKKLRLHDLSRNRADWVSECRAKSEIAALKELTQRQQKIESLYRMQSPEIEPRLAEIRQRLREMDLGERIDTVRNALLNPKENKNTILAVATAEANLSAAIPQHIAECRQKLAEEAYPDDLNAINEIQTELGTISRAHENFADLVFEKYIKDGTELADKKRQREFAFSIKE